MKKQLIVSTFCILSPLAVSASCGETHADGTATCGMPDHTMHQEGAPMAMPTMMNMETMDHSQMDHSMHMPQATMAEMPMMPQSEASSEMDHSMHQETMEPMMDSTLEDPESMPAIDHSAMGHSMNMTFKGKRTESSEAYFAANMDMHTNMAIEFTNDADIDFLKGMIPHHQGAIDMAKIQLAHGKDGSLKHVTGRIIRDQEREIAWLKAILANEEKNTPVLNEMAAEEAEEHNTLMHEKMNIKFSGNADIDFVKGMIPHHEGAIAMAKTVLKYGNNRAAKRMAYDIINAQQGEIYWMNQWLRRVNRR